MRSMESLRDVLIVFANGCAEEMLPTSSNLDSGPTPKPEAWRKRRFAWARDCNSLELRCYLPAYLEDATGWQGTMNSGSPTPCGHVAFYILSCAPIRICASYLAVPVLMNR